MPCNPGPQCWGRRDPRTGVNATVYDAACRPLYDTYIVGCGEAPATVAPGVIVNPVATPGQPAPQPVTGGGGGGGGGGGDDKKNDPEVPAKFDLAALAKNPLVIAVAGVLAAWQFGLIGQTGHK